MAGAARAQTTGWSVDVEGRLLAAEDGDIVWRADDTGAATSTIGIDEAWAGRAAITSPKLMGGVDFSLAYTGLRSDSENAAFTGTAPGYAYPVQGTYAYGYDAGSASAETDYDVVDFEAGLDVGLGAVRARPFVGLRWADHSTSLGTGFRTVPATTALSENRETQFDGIGPRIGLTARVPLTPIVFVEAMGAWSALFGDRDTRIATTDGFTGTTTTARRSFDDTIHTFEGTVGLGLDLAPMAGVPVEVLLGYRYETWIGILDTANFADLNNGAPIFPAGRFGSVDDDQTFHAGFLRLRLRF